MAVNNFLASMYAYPWDLHDEYGALDKIAETGCTEVMLAASYHVSTYFLPRNPKRPIYWGEDGAIYFRPNYSRYPRSYIRPRVSSLVEHPRYFENLAASIQKYGLQFGAWIVYLYNHHAAEQYPECARHDAFGTPYLGQLSIASGAVREYCHWLTDYILDTFKPASIHVESLNRMNWNYGFRNPKVLTPISERCQFLLGIDFNPAAVEAFDRREGSRLQAEVAKWLSTELPRMPSENGNDTVDEHWIRNAFGGNLAFYLEAAQQQTTEFWTTIAKLIHEKGAKVQSGLVTPASSWRTDLREECNSHLDRVTVAPGLNSFQVEAIKKKVSQSATVLVSTNPGSMTEAAPLMQQVQSAATAGCGGATFYNFGLLRDGHLKFIQTALKSL